MTGWLIFPKKINHKKGETDVGRWWWALGVAHSWDTPGFTASIKTKDDDAYNIMSSFVVALKIIGLMTYDQRI